MANRTDTAAAPKTFRAAFCECFRCPAEAFLDTFFRKALHPPLRPLAWLVRRVAPRFFREDLQHLERIGETCAWQEYSTLANQIRGDVTLNHGLLRKGLHLRVSGFRLIRLYQQITKRRRQSFL